MKASRIALYGVLAVLGAVLVSCTDAPGGAPVVMAAVSKNVADTDLVPVITIIKAGFSGMASGAVVSVDGEACDEFFPGTGIYFASNPVPSSVGATHDLVIDYEGIHMTASADMPEGPTSVTAPATLVRAAGDITVSYTFAAGSIPSWATLSIGSDDTADGEVYSDAHLAVESGSFLIPGGTLAVGSIMVTVGGAEMVDVTGAYPGSILEAINSDWDTFTTE